MTLYKFYKYFDRLSQFKNYDTTTLFTTVSSDVKIEPWFKSFEERKMKCKQLAKKNCLPKLKLVKKIGGIKVKHYLIHDTCKHFLKLTIIYTSLE